MKRLAALLCALCFGACDSKAPEGDGSAMCTANADCDDGVYCNGAETCAPEDPGAGPDGCFPGTAPCADVCDEATETCAADCGIPDADGDGLDSVLCGGTDCDDGDANRFPGNTEVCDLDGHDEDCNPRTFGAADNDRDGFVDARCCNRDGDGVERCGDDCNDGRADVSPIATEACDLYDNDCDGMVDEGVAVPGYADRDHDFRGDADAPRLFCAGRLGFSPAPGDCDDTNPRVNDVAPESCDSLDNDCDEATDENLLSVPWYVDGDEDAFGQFDLGAPVACMAPGPEYTNVSQDCVDDDGAVNPLAEETCNARDDDCDGYADFAIAEGDLEDDDGDGYADAACGGDDCDDLDFTTFPGAEDRVDGRDNDCDGTIDEGAVVFYADTDGDGHGDPDTSQAAIEAPEGFVSIAGDCSDGEPSVFPGATEVCDGVDQDCDGAVDEGLLRVHCPDADRDGFGAPGAGCELACPGAATAGLGLGLYDCDDGDRNVNPGAPDVCDDGIDSDCDGIDACASCGNGTCEEELRETPLTCRDDCPGSCPNGTCSDGETGVTCPEDCLCGVNERVESNACVPCEPGRTNAAGDDLTGPDTGCRIIRCTSEEYVSSNRCVTCPLNEWNPPGGDPASGPDTMCEDACMDALGIPCSTFQGEYVKASNAEASDGFGHDVVLDGDTMAVSALGEASSAQGVGGNQADNTAPSSGAVYVFVRTAGVWSQQAYIKAPDNDGSASGFGTSLALAGDTLVVGDPYDHDGAIADVGSAFVFTRTAGVWSEQAHLRPPVRDPNDQFGTAVALSGDTLVVGAPYEDGGAGGDPMDDSLSQAGAVFVFTRSGGTWSAPTYLKAASPLDTELFGSSLALDGDNLVVGPADFVGLNRWIHFFRRTGGTWSEEQAYRFRPSSLAVDADTAVAVANPVDSASVYSRGAGSWPLGQELTFPQGVRDAAIEGDLLVIGEYQGGGSKGGVGGDPDPSERNQGAAHLYRNTAGTWTAVLRFQAEYPSNDRFGWSVALSGTTIAIGDPVEDGGSTGFGGDPMSTAAPGSGAVYLRYLAP